MNSQLDDNTLLLQLIRGDAQAFTALFYRYQTFLRAEAFSMLRNHQEAEDITQEVFADVWRRRQKLNPEVPIRFYLFKAIRFQVSKKYRSQSYEQRYKEYVARDIMATNTNDLVSQQLENKERVLRVYEAMHAIPAYTQAAFRKAYLEDENCKQIAADLNIGLQTVYNQLSSALKSIRKHLKVKE
ncbi:RNA polymerase sigma factor [Chitinophaga sp. S165]|uniref:RNA polymerase sigma factor n=1 Tax=Chitinophaga sp. S165 TaxID=2135462 RepID=UPI000D71CE18|nr:sigma-70 family RNA polymerase sigma factor [Chitinophaga sp. S165]PWV47100.1 RNA polymerase sigma-70 factor (ECF subfamily) [Chitinophaga sp. S165]